MTKCEALALDLQNAEQSRAYHAKTAKEKFGAEREHQLRLMRHYEKVISAIKTQMAKEGC